MPPGSYTLDVRAPGFAEFRKAVVLPGDFQMNVMLDVGSVTEAVEVVGKSPRPPAAAGTPHRIRVGGNVQATKLISMVKPAYPPGAEAAGIEGTVMLKAVISTAGDLLNLSVLNTAVDPELASRRYGRRPAVALPTDLAQRSPRGSSHHHCRDVPTGALTNWRAAGGFLLLR